MRKFLLLIFIAFLSFHSSAQELPFVKEPVFQAGEVLQYKLKYGFITAAEGTLKVLEGDLKFDGNLHTD
jgi:hypothetical protein